MNKIILIFSIVAVVVISTVSVFLFNSQNSESENNTNLKSAAENYPEFDRSKYCGSGLSTQSKYVQEYIIPTECAQPHAIMIDYDGNPWFTQSNLGGLSKFDLQSQSFTEFKNLLWPKNKPSLMAGIDSASDSSIWFTDDTYDSIWKFDINTSEYHRFPFSSNGNSNPQKLQIVGSQMIVNDFLGNKLVIYDLNSSDQNMDPFLLSSPNPKAITSSFTLDNEKNIWYSSWEKESSGTLISINNTALESIFQDFDNSSLDLSIDYYVLPDDTAINGLDFDFEGNLWLADSYSSNFYKLKPSMENKNTLDVNYTKYVTSDPSLNSLKVHTGNTESSISRPTWMKSDSNGQIIFNEVDANRIAIFNPYKETLIEYEIPSRNPYWGECGDDTNCGNSQILDFSIYKEKIWFTEWAENKIGYVDTKIPVPLYVELNPNSISLHPGEEKTVDFILTPIDKGQTTILPFVSNPNNDLKIQMDSNQTKYHLDSGEYLRIKLKVTAETVIPNGEYKILAGSSLPGVSIGQFLTVLID